MSPRVAIPAPALHLRAADTPVTASRATRHLQVEAADRLVVIAATAVAEVTEATAEAQATAEETPAAEIKAVVAIKVAAEASPTATVAANRS
jgi:hypothetical protein